MKKEKRKIIKGWAVVCNNPKEVSNVVFAFVNKNTAILKARDLNEELSGRCRHKVIECKIILPKVV